MKREPVLLQLDDRRRLPLGRLAKAHKLFLASVDDDGIITLTPAKVVPVIEPVSLTKYPEILDAIRRARHEHDAVRRGLGRPRRASATPKDPGRLITCSTACREMHTYGYGCSLKSPRPDKRPI